VADLGVRGVWQPQTEALFDVHVVDIDAQLYVHRTVNAVFSTAEKKRRGSTLMQHKHTMHPSPHL